MGQASSNQQKQVIDEYEALWNGEFSRIDVVADSASVYDPAAPDGVVHGRDAVDTHLRETFRAFPDFELEDVSHRKRNRIPRIDSGTIPPPEHDDRIAPVNELVWFDCDIPPPAFEGREDTLDDFVWAVMGPTTSGDPFGSMELNFFVPRIGHSLYITRSDRLVQSFHDLDVVVPLASTLVEWEEYAKRGDVEITSVGTVSEPGVNFRLEQPVPGLW